MLSIMEKMQALKLIALESSGEMCSLLTKLLHKLWAKKCVNPKTIVLYT